ncbi:hypothetical protein IPA_07610 [Ignicoccus pacificus DSM 13166]|uniref:Uncharacterized protein n=1 Tax=Ignicoccus pacificus DSM 13166 TaxID=940294 RepID=A0A977KBP9_9CREN|nr:hypothetical protein IPA_07610 [Ignicoccus pacificus DSM 13166]
MLTNREELLRWSLIALLLTSVLLAYFNVVLPNQVGIVKVKSDGIVAVAGNCAYFMDKELHIKDVKCNVVSADYCCGKEYLLYSDRLVVLPKGIVIPINGKDVFAFKNVIIVIGEDWIRAFNGTEELWSLDLPGIKEVKVRGDEVLAITSNKAYLINLKSGKVLGRYDGTVFDVCSDYLVSYSPSDDKLSLYYFKFSKHTPAWYTYIKGVSDVMFNANCSVFAIASKGIVIVLDVRGEELKYEHLKSGTIKLGSNIAVIVNGKQLSAKEFSVPNVKASLNLVTFVTKASVSQSISLTTGIGTFTAWANGTLSVLTNKEVPVTMSSSLFGTLSQRNNTVTIYLSRVVKAEAFGIEVTKTKVTTITFTTDKYILLNSAAASTRYVICPEAAVTNTICLVKTITTESPPHGLVTFLKPSIIVKTLTVMKVSPPIISGTVAKITKTVTLTYTEYLGGSFMPALSFYEITSSLVTTLEKVYTDVIKVISQMLSAIFQPWVRFYTVTLSKLLPSIKVTNTNILTLIQATFLAPSMNATGGPYWDRGVVFVLSFMNPPKIPLDSVEVRFGRRTICTYSYLVASVGSNVIGTSVPQSRTVEDLKTGKPISVNKISGIVVSGYHGLSKREVDDKDSIAPGIILFTTSDMGNSAVYSSASFAMLKKGILVGKIGNTLFYSPYKPFATVVNGVLELVYVSRSKVETNFRKTNAIITFDRWAGRSVSVAYDGTHKYQADLYDIVGIKKDLWSLIVYCDNVNVNVMPQVTLRLTFIDGSVWSVNIPLAVQ